MGFDGDSSDCSDAEKFYLNDVYIPIKKNLTDCIYLYILYINFRFVL